MAAHILRERVDDHVGAMSQGLLEHRPRSVLSSLFSGSGVLGSCDHGRHQLAEEGSAAAAGVVHEREEAQVQRQLFL